MALPATPLLDSFTRANETPLAAPWVDSTYWWGQGLDLVSNAVANGDLVGPFFGGGSYWGSSTFGPDLEAYVTVSVIPTNTGAYVGLDLSASDLAGPGPVTTFDLQLTCLGGTSFSFNLEKWVADAFIGTVASTTVTLANGDQIGVRRIGSTFWLFQNGAVVATGTDASSYVPLTVGLFLLEEAATQLIRLDAVGAGTLTAPISPPSTGDPVLLGTPSQGRTTSLAPVAVSHTVPSGAGALLVYIAQHVTEQPVPTVTWGSQNVPLLNEHDPIADLPCTFLLLNPTPGASTLTVTPNDPFFSSLAFGAVNIGNYGGIRFADWAYSNGAGGPFTPISSMHTEPTDLVLSCIAQTDAGATFGPTNMTTVVDQGGIGDSAIKLAIGVADVVTDYTTIDWTLNSYAFFDVHLMAIKRLDGIPAGAPYAIGPVTNTLTVESQPALPFGLGPFPLPGDYWHWWHTVPATHRTLVVLLAWADPFAPVVSVTFGGIPMVDYYSPGNNRAMFVLENAPVGTFLIEVEQFLLPFGPLRRTFMAGAYSIASEGIFGVASNITPLKSIDVDAQPDAIAIALVDYGQFEPVAFINAEAAPGSTLLWAQPIYFNSNNQEGNRPAINSTADNGISVYTVAAGPVASPAWTSPLSTFTVQIAFSFIPSPPPPPPPSTGCPNSLPLAPVAGTGCAHSLQSPAV